MTRRLIGAKSGWGKSRELQRIVEANAPEKDYLLVLDLKDEYRGLVKGGLASHFIAGPRERDWTATDWQALLSANPKTVVARYRIGIEAWREACARMITAARRLAREGNEVVVVVEEAHFVAPQDGKLLDPVKGLATTGRGEGAASMWVSQRLAEVDETVVAQADERLLGGFTSDADLTKVGKSAEYPPEIHNPNAGTQQTEKYPPELLVDGVAIPLRKFSDDDGDTIGSEWIFSDDDGKIERRNTKGTEMQTTHYGKRATEIIDP
ncbi:ATP-binding protein [Halosegnis longus]|uniref:ATP-binding protein n=1 Tax=Halosegnis longus TaxID=2216012 RepID=UPI001F2A3ED7|nr:ATP-binding protein [Halosegnis longus]